MDYILGARLQHLSIMQNCFLKLCIDKSCHLCNDFQEKKGSFNKGLVFMEQTTFMNVVLRFCFAGNGRVCSRLESFF